MEGSSQSEDEVNATPKSIRNFKLLLDSDSEEDFTTTKPSNPEIEISSPNEPLNNGTNDSSDSENCSPVKTSEIKNRRKNSNPKKKIVVQRKSAAKAMDVIKQKMSHKQHSELKQEIQSEKQRMEREQEISVPYLKPKQYSLKEFLARRTLKNPFIEKTAGKHLNTIMAIKKATANIEDFALKMKERGDEAIEFFKSESESDENEEVAPSNTISKTTDESDLVDAKSVLTTEEKPHSSFELEDLVDKVDTIDSSQEAIVSDSNKENMNESIDKEEQQNTEIVSETNHEADELDRLREKYKNVPETSDVKTEKQKAVLPLAKLKTLEEMYSKDAVIDLKTGIVQSRQLSGPEILFQRYLKTVQKPKEKDSVCLNILSFENGKLENQKVEVKLNKKEELDHNRPGFSHEMLKENLRNKIKHKRLEEIKTKSLKVELEPEEKSSCNDTADIEDELDEPEEELENEEESEEDDVEEEMAEEKKVKGVGSKFLDDEAIDEDESNEEVESDDSSSDDEEEIGTDNAPKKSRIVTAFEDSDDEESLQHDKVNHEEEVTISETGHNEIEFDPQDIESSIEPLQSHPEPITVYDVLATQPESKESDTQQTDFSFNEPSVSEEITESGIQMLCDPYGSSQIAEDDLFDICSGRFDSTQAVNTQLPLEGSRDEIPDSVDGSQFVSQVVSQLNPRKLLESSDDEVVEASEKVVAEKRKKKKKRKQVKKLDFSDDEDESVTDSLPVEESASELDDEEKEDEEEEKNFLIDYDSEENEIEISMGKKDRIKAAGAFFEQEAELSESEWGSADEDEKDLNKLDIELGDEEHFDQEKLQEEVGRIHARKMLDDDIRNVKKIEDLLFMDEENDGVGRERKFRWKNQTETTFSTQDENAMFGDAHDEGELDEESEIMWRKMRHERETMLSENSEKLTESEEILLLDYDSQTVTSSSVSMLAKRKFRIIKNSSVMEMSPSNEPKVISPFLIKTSNLKNFQHSSFLSRDEQTLNKIARFVSYKDDEVTNLSSHGGNSMSFTSIEKHDENKKRKFDEKSPQELSKKRKIVTQVKHLLLDHLQ